MSKFKTGIAMSALWLFAGCGTTALAETDPNAEINAATERLKAQTSYFEAQTAQINAKAEQDKAKIAALGLPQFQNSTKLEDKGGEIEATLLATRAVSKAAKVIADEVGKASPQGKILVLSPSQTIDLNSGKVMRVRMKYVDQLFTNAMPKQEPEAQKEGLVPLAGAVQAITALAGLIGNEVTVTGVDLAALNDQVLIAAVAGQDAIKGRAILPLATPGIADIENSDLAKKLGELATLRATAAKQLADIQKLPKAKQAKEKVRADALKTAIDGFDAFYKEIGTAGSDGMIPLVRAILAESTAALDHLSILRIAVAKAGGSITNSKNLWTFVGFDPVRVSGGLDVTYSLVDARDGSVLTSDTIACQTARTKLRAVQSGNWFGQDGSADTRKQATAFCHGRADLTVH